MEPYDVLKLNPSEKKRWDADSLDLFSTNRNFEKIHPNLLDDIKFEKIQVDSSKKEHLKQ